MMKSISQRPYSITTRIKTDATVYQTANFILVRDHIPLQQGLRLFPSHPSSQPPSRRSETIFHYNKD